jgi:3-dehydroquinate synthase
MAPERYFELMALDKKAAHGRTRYVLLERIGSAVVRADLEDRVVREAIAAASPAAAAAAPR